MLRAGRPRGQWATVGPLRIGAMAAEDILIGRSLRDARLPSWPDAEGGRPGGRRHRELPVAGRARHRQPVDRHPASHRRGAGHHHRHAARQRGAAWPPGAARRSAGDRLRGPRRPRRVPDRWGERPPAGDRVVHRAGWRHRPRRVRARIGRGVPASCWTAAWSCGSATSTTGSRRATRSATPVASPTATRIPGPGVARVLFVLTPPSF